ncbi:hypothetical protein [Sciscionella marina]|uniref:hypothetical protein n=1 Tax=Sciscionella marina TaxID=508770 RepID=UPI0003625A95|nr:hypothetical protein [Sciscionella marina]
MATMKITPRKPRGRRQRSLQRAVHLTLGLFLLVELYLSPLLGPGFTTTVQWLVAPVVVASGIAMWKGQRIRHALRARAARHA